MKAKNLSTMTLGMAILGLAALSRPVFAGADPCKDERAKFCQGVKVGKPMRACLLKHESELSQTCKNAMKVVHSKAKGPNKPAAGATPTPAAPPPSGAGAPPSSGQ